MIQGGGLDADMHQRPTRRPIRNEADNGLSNRAFTVAMARNPDPHSATVQFFINLADNPFLDHQDDSPAGWGYCVFGRVCGGRPVVEAIGHLPTGARAGHQDVPLEPVIIHRARLLSH